MKTRIHFEVLNLSKMVLNYRENFVKSCTINFMMQTAVMGTKYRSGFHSIFNLRINLDMISQVPVGGPLTVGILHINENGGGRNGSAASLTPFSFIWSLCRSVARSLALYLYIYIRESLSAQEMAARPSSSAACQPTSTIGGSPATPESTCHGAWARVTVLFDC
jgi:hypothetical protein